MKKTAMFSNAFDDYQERASGTSTYKKYTPFLLALGLCEEAGEAAGKMKRKIRDKMPMHVFREELALELGDTLWYLSQLARKYELKLSDVARMNIEKVESRRARGTTHGQGDHR